MANLFFALRKVSTLGLAMGLVIPQVNPALAQFSGPAFWRTVDATPPPALTAFSAETGALDGQILLTVDFPADVTDYSRVDIRRLAGATAPNADCASDGVVAKTYASGQFNDGTHTDAGLTPGSYYSYRACIYDASGNLTATQTDVNNQAKPAPPYHRIFVTSTSTTGDFGGFAGADAICQTRANAGGLGGSWRAILSTSTVDARDRILDRYGEIWDVRPSGSGGPQRVADDMLDLFDGSLDLEVEYDELGANLSSVTRAWTGSVPEATSSGSTCSDWTSAAASGTAGRPASATTSFFLDSGGSSCANSHRLICIDGQDVFTPLALDRFKAEPRVTNAGEIKLTIDFPSDVSGYQQVVIRRIAGLAAPNADCTSDGTVVKTYTSGMFNDEILVDSGLTPGSEYSYRVCITDASANLTSVQSAVGVQARTSTIHRIFVTSTTYAGNLGDAGANTKCQTQATAAGLGGTWKALISTAAVDAKDRVTISGNVFNLRPGADAAQSVADDAADLWDNMVDASIGYTEFGVQVAADTGVWTGTTGLGVENTDHCQSWTSALNAVWGGSGRIGYRNSGWVYGSLSVCDLPRSLYCIEQ